MGMKFFQISLKENGMKKVDFQDYKTFLIRKFKVKFQR